MIRNKLYDELEKEGYSFDRIIIAPKQSIPKIYSLTDPEDWAMVNVTMQINGQYQVERGSAATNHTIELLQKILDEVFKPDYYDYISKSLIESTSI